MRALALLPPGSFRALVVGDGEDRPEVEEEVRRLGLTQVVELTGEREDVAPLLARADIFVLSSRWEALPISVLEGWPPGSRWWRRTSTACGRW